jgi:hypothetical protein
MINRKDGGVAAQMIKEILGEGSKNISDSDRKRIQDIFGAESSRTISDADRKRVTEIIKLLGKKDTPKHRGTGPKNAKGGVASYAHGGLEESSRTISNADRAKVDAILAKYTGESSRTISNADRKRAEEILTGESSRTISNADRKRLQEILNQNAKGGFAHGNIVRAGEEGSRLSISMEKQEDAGFSPSEADFREQHKLALEGVMDVGADVTIVQGHDSRKQLGETDKARGMGAAVKGTGFKGVF